MKEEASKEDILVLLNQGLIDAEESINAHPDETIALYQKGKHYFEEEGSLQQETDWTRAAGVSASQLEVMNRYLLAYSFISAWYHLNGDKTRRDNLANSASILCAGLGFKAEDILISFVECERAWRSTMKSPMLKTRQTGFIVLAILVLAGVAAIFALSSISASFRGPIVIFILIAVVFSIFMSKTKKDS